MHTTHINEITAEQYRKLEAKASAVENALNELLAATVGADIPDNVKVNLLKWIGRAETFRGLSYFLHPQPEWIGGDNSKIRAPHIAHL